MKQEPKMRYSQSDLNEFEDLLLSKIKKAKFELDHFKESISQKKGGGDDNIGRLKSLDDGADVLEKEHLNQLAARTQKFISQMEDALIRVKNGTYGICVDTGNLIPKDRLRAVPHTKHCIEAKLKSAN
ncbi:MAG: TraR/DksA family transcriptional regulator [Bacteroidetes bacterium]|nr:MAG: TraR/DksA family transcriptional regulator [Bacteroidota bacterium]